MSENKKTLLEILAELDGQYQTIEDYCQEEGTDTPPEHLLEGLELSEQELENKLSNYVHYFQHLQSVVQGYKDEKKRLDAKIKEYQRRALWAKETIQMALQNYGSINKNGSFFYDIGVNKISLVPSYSVKITDAESLPSKYKTTEVKEVENIDKTAIKKALKQEPVQGAELIENSSLRFNNISLQVK